jgi:ribosomal protein S4
MASSRYGPLLKRYNLFGLDFCSTKWLPSKKKLSARTVRRLKGEASLPEFKVAKYDATRHFQWGRRVLQQMYGGLSLKAFIGIYQKARKSSTNIVSVPNGRGSESSGSESQSRSEVFGRERFRCDPLFFLSRFLELRLDTTLVRMGLTGSFREARQWIYHSHILVNGKVSSRPSQILSVRDIVEVRFNSSVRSLLFSKGRTCNSLVVGHQKGLYLLNVGSSIFFGCIFYVVFGWYFRNFFESKEHYYSFDVS